MKTPFLTRLSLLLLLGLSCALSQGLRAQTFNLGMQPSSLTLIPGETASLVVSMTPVAGFSSPVELSVAMLPDGVTATFSPNPVTLPGTSLLTLRATTNAAVGAFSLDVTGVGGGVTNTTSSSVTVNFGLLPLCTAGFTGVITDAQTGLPIPGAQVLAQYYSSFSATADAHGGYLITNVSLGDDNTAERYTVRAVAAGYWESPNVSSYAVCDATNALDFQLVPEQYGTVSGTVTAQGGGPVAGVTIFLSGASYLSAVTDTNGNYAVTNVILGYTNAPSLYRVSFQTSAQYWGAVSNTIVSGGSNSIVNFALDPVCGATVIGQVIYGDSLLPATNAAVTVYGGDGAVSVTTDGSGNFVAAGVSLGANNTPILGQATAQAPGSQYYAGRANFRMTNCGSTIDMGAITLPPVPVIITHYAALTGHVYDVQTGLPVAGATVGGARTDTNGGYLWTNIYVGTGAVTNSTISVYSSAPGYFNLYTNATLNADQTTALDIQLLKTGYGGIQGTLLDAVTTLPVTNVNIDFSGVGQATTDANGHFFSGPIPLTFGNVPTSESVYASATGYYPVSTNLTIRSGVTNAITLRMLKVCTGATIVGNVVNALDQKPITNATVFIPGTVSQMTDTNGSFALTNITVGNLNSPIQVTVTAMAPGFNRQSHTVTIFCDATINTEFGAPQTAFGTIQGYVTNVVTGLPLAGAFIGSGFGEATTTDTNGFYQLSQAPLGANGADRIWTVTAIPDGFSAKTLSVTVSSNAVSSLDFGFGEPPTHLLLSETSAPSPVTVGSNVVYTITLLNNGADAANVQLTDQLPSSVTFVSAGLTNPADGSFSTPVYSNNAVTTTATNFAAGDTLVLVVTASPTAVGDFSNTATVISSTPDTDPTGTNRTATVMNTATQPVPLNADLYARITANPDPVTAGYQLTYTITVGNNGPATAPDVVLDDLLPPGVMFVSALVTEGPSQGTFNQNGGALHWDLGALPDESHATITLVVAPQDAGPLENTVTAALGSQVLGVIDPSAGDNTATAEVTVVAPILRADVGLSVTATPEPVGLSNQITYTFTISNSGPATAPDVVLTDILPPNTSFVSASSSQGGYNHAGTWDLGAIPDESSATVTLVVTPLVAGLLTNSATIALGSEVSGVIDPNPDNDSATVVSTVNGLAVTGTNVTVIAAGALQLDPQTGLYRQTVQVENLSGLPASAVRLLVPGLPAGVTLFNAGGSTNGVPYVEYDATVPPEGAVSFVLEYFSATRQPFASTNFTALSVPPATVTPPSGAVVQLDQPPSFRNGALLIEFSAVPGDTYVVQYSADLVTWKSAVPAVVAAGTRVQWTDSGPPKTDSAPSPTGQRFYQVLQLAK